MKILILLLSMTLLAGCESMSSQSHLTAQALLKARIADAYIESGQVESTLLEADLSEAEVDIVIHALETYQWLKAKYSDLDPDSFTSVMPDIINDRARARSAYEGLYNVVVDHIDEYSPEGVRNLEFWHETAVSIDQVVEQLIQAGSTQAAVLLYAEYALLIAKVATL